MSRRHPLIVALLLAGAAFVAATPARTADHRDAPSINVDGSADINDVYAFVNPNNGNVVLAMTVNPLVVPGVPAVFGHDVLYQLKIDNTGDVREDLVIQATFTKGSNQQVTVRGPARPRKVGVETHLLGGPGVSGPADGSVIQGSNIKVFAGLREDPFFFDFVFVLRLIGLLPGGPLQRAPGRDFFAGMNTSILAVEVPAKALRGSKKNTIFVWGTTSRARQTKRVRLRDNREKPPFGQVERMGLPTINTVLINSSNKDLFNRSAPEDDERFRPEAIEHLVPINGDAAYSETLSRALLPDALPLDVTNSTQGFEALNGRRPQDDVIDVVLSLASKGAVTSDAVNSNDRQFLTDFPFFATPHDPSITIPPRN